MWRWKFDLPSFQKKNVECRELEITLSGVGSCLEKGLNVIQGDANYDLEDYPDNSFSTVILSQTIQAMIYPERVIENLIRIGTRAIISFPNFGYWKVRRDFYFQEECQKTKYYLSNGMTLLTSIYVLTTTFIIIVSLKKFWCKNFIV